MTNTYRVIIVDPSEHSLKEGENQYDLYALWEKCKLPYGVWLEHWTVPDGQEWNTHPAKSAHELCKHNCYLVEWDELQEPWNVKTKSWWTAKRHLLHAIEVAQSQLADLASVHIDEVAKVLYPDEEGFDQEEYDEYMQGHQGRITDTMVTNFALQKVNITIHDIQGDEIIVDE